MRSFFKTQPQIIIDVLILNGVFLILLFLLFKKLLPLYFYPAWDQSHHLLVAQGYYEAIVNMDPGEFWRVLIQSHTIYPPLFHIAIAIGYVVFGIRDKIGMFVNFPFALLLGISTYLLARVAVTKRSALIAGILTFFVPLYIDLWTDTMTDISSVALFITFYWATLKTNYFRSTKWSIFLGIIALFLLLSRYAFFNAAIPLIVYAFISLRKNGSVALKNLLLTLIVLLPAEIWYVSHWNIIHEKLTFFGDAQNYPVQLYKLPTLFEVNNWIYFPLASVQIQGIGLIPMLLFMGSLISRHFKKTPLGTYLLWSVLCNFLVQTIWLDKIPKYVEYSYPLIIILTVDWIMSMKKWSGVLLVLLTGSMIINVLIALTIFPKETGIGNIYQSVYVLPGVRFEYDTASWPLQQIIGDLPQAAERRTRLLLLTDTHILNGVTLSYYAMRSKKYLDIATPADLYDLVQPHVITEKDLTVFEYILTKSEGDFGIFVNYEATRQINSVLNNATWLIKIKSYRLPDGTQAHLYQSRAQPPADALYE